MALVNEEKTEQKGTDDEIAIRTLSVRNRDKNKKLNLNSPKGLHIKAQGCGTPLPWVNVQQSLFPTLKGLRKFTLCNPFRVKMNYGSGFTQGSGVPRPWAILFNPFRIKNVPQVLINDFDKEGADWVAGNVRVGNEGYMYFATIAYFVVCPENKFGTQGLSQANEARRDCP